MSETIVAKFPNSTSIDQAKLGLMRAGFPSHDISILKKKAVVGETVSSGSLLLNTVNGAFSGVIGGGVIGAFVGFLIGFGYLNFTGINWFLVAVPLAHALGITGLAATTLSGVILGAIVGGVIGGLMGLSIPESEVFTYEENLAPGESMLAVDSGSDRVYEIRQILEAFGAEKVSVRQEADVQERYYPPYSVIGFKGGKTKNKKKNSS